MNAAIGGYPVEASPSRQASRHPEIRGKNHRSKPSRFTYRTTRAPPPAISFSTSLRVAIEVSPGVVEARAPWAAP